MGFHKIYVLGAGAVGCYFGGMLARAHHDVTLIARPDRAKAINTSGLTMDCKSFCETVHVNASSDISLLRDADLVLLSVKSPDTKKVIEDIAPILSHRAVILSLQNGVANVDIATQIIPNPIYPAAVYVACGMVGDTVMKHHGRGELLVGCLSQASVQDLEILGELCHLFKSSSVPCDIAPQIDRDMWLKFLVNCSYNGISGIGQMSYGEMVKIPEVMALIEGITAEFLAIATCKGIKITAAEAKEANELIAKTMATQISSTAQDLAKNKRTEIDFLNGYIVELGRRYGIPTPYNESIFSMVRMLELKQ